MKEPFELYTEILESVRYLMKLRKSELNQNDIAHIEAMKEKQQEMVSKMSDEELALLLCFAADIIGSIGIQKKGLATAPMVARGIMSAFGDSVKKTNGPNAHGADIIYSTLDFPTCDMGTIEEAVKTLEEMKGKFGLSEEKIKSAKEKLRLLKDKVAPMNLFTNFMINKEK